MRDLPGSSLSASAVGREGLCPEEAASFLEILLEPALARGGRLLSVNVLALKNGGDARVKSLTAVAWLISPLGHEACLGCWGSDGVELIGVGETSGGLISLLQAQVLGLAHTLLYA